MKSFIFPLLLIAIPLAAPPIGFDARVETLRQKTGVPGMAIAIVEGGKTVLARGYGTRRLGSPDKVDADTIFMTGSTGKAFTTAALATLVDAGRISWDDKVADPIRGGARFERLVDACLASKDVA